MGAVKMGSTKKYIVDLGLYEGYMFYEEDGGLYCNCPEGRPTFSDDEYQPCVHAWGAMRGGVDNNLAEHLVSMNSSFAIVPLFKKRQYSERVPTHGVLFNHEAKKFSMTPFSLDGNTNVVAGWLDESEGRWALRRIILEHLYGLYYTMGLYCQNDQHNSYLMTRTERRRRDLDPTQRHVLAAVSSVLQHDMCWECKNLSYEDTVPEV